MTTTTASASAVATETSITSTPVTNITIPQDSSLAGFLKVANSAPKLTAEAEAQLARRYRDEDDGVSRGYAVHASTWLNGERWLDEEVQQPVVGSEDSQWQILNQQHLIFSVPFKF